MSSYQQEFEFSGGVLGKGVAGGKRPARLTVDARGIRATLEDGSAHAGEWPGMTLEQGGASSTLILCHGRGKKLTFYSEDPDFLRALETLGGNDLADELARLAGQRVSSRPKHLIGCALTLVILVGLIWGIPKAFRGTLDVAVDALPLSVDAAIGESVVGQMDAGGREVKDETLTAAIQAILDRLTPHLEQDVEVHFRIIENELANAYALPGGYITVFTGLLAESESAEQVAGVLAHELAHVTERHGLRRIAHSIGVIVGVQVILGDAEGLAGLAAELFTLATVNDYSQEQETQADLVGVELLAQARIDPDALAGFFRLLEEREGDLPDGLSWMSTHPLHRERIETIREHRAQLTEREYVPLEIDWDAVHAALEEL